MLLAGRGLPRMGTTQVETGGPFRMGFVPASFSSHPAARATNSPAGMEKRSLSGFGFCIVLGWRTMGEWRAIGR